MSLAVSNSATVPARRFRALLALLPHVARVAPARCARCSLATPPGWT